MKHVSFWILFATLAAAGTVASARPVNPLQVLATNECVAQPGNVPIPLTATNMNLEAADWTTATVSSNVPGQFFLKFQQALSNATVITYDAAEIQHRAGGKWKPLRLDREASRRLKVVPLPEDELFNELRITVPARPATGAGPLTGFHATLPFVCIIPARLINIAPSAKVAVSSGELLKPAVLFDGEVDPVRNFTTAWKPKDAAAPFSEWLALTWERKEAVRGWGLFHGPADKGIGDAVIEAFVGKGDALASTNAAAWQQPGYRPLPAGRFARNQFAVVSHEFNIDALRFRSTNGPTQFSLGEIVIFQELPETPKPEVPAPPSAPVRGTNSLLPSLPVALPPLEKK